MADNEWIPYTVVFVIGMGIGGCAVSTWRDARPGPTPQSPRWVVSTDFGATEVEFPADFRVEGALGNVAVFDTKGAPVGVFTHANAILTREPINAR